MLSLGSKKLLIVLSIVLSGLSSAWADDSIGRLNKIFLWEMSNHLDLSPTDEKMVAQVVNDLQTRRSRALENRQNSLECLKKKQSGCLERYVQATNELSKLDMEEYNRLLSVLGEERLGQFLVKRHEIVSRVRDALKR